MEQEIKYWYLRNHKLFRNLANSEINELCILTGMVRANKSEYIYLPNDEKRIFILKKGIIKIVAEDDEGNEVTKDIIMAGDIFGELTLDTTLNNNSNQELAVVASKEVIICSFLVENFEKLLASKPELSLSYMKWVGFKLSKLKMRYADLVAKDVKTRLLNFMQNWIIENGEQKENNWHIKNVLTQKDIAGIIGATRQTVATTISQLEDQGVLVYGRDEIILKNNN
jgi:CRP/FNR family transcriptional regulator, cyclic AMP receptor protein